MIYLVTNQTSINSTFQSKTAEDVLDYFKDIEEIAIDTETEGFDPHTKNLLTIQFGDRDNQFVVDTTTVSIQIFKTLLETKTLLLQNAKFDLRFLYKQYIIPFKVYDTFLAESVLYMGVVNHRKGLDALTERYCGVKLDKSIRGDIHRYGLSDAVIEYAGKDVMYLHDIKEKQILLLKEKDLVHALDLDNKFVLALAYTEYCGIGFDQEFWTYKCKKDAEALASVTKELDDFILDNNHYKYIDSQLNLFDTGVSCAINWNSEKQVIPLMKELKVNTRTKDKKTGKEKDSLESIVLQSQTNVHPLVQLYLKYKKVEKLRSSFGSNYLRFVNKRTGRIHTTYKQLVNTGRMSCGNDKDNAPNLQQVPSDHHRKAFVPRKGNSFISCDYSSQESRVLAEFSKDKNLVEFYTSGEADLHSYAVKLVYPEAKDCNLAEIKDRFKEERQVMKGFNFALA